MSVSGGGEIEIQAGQAALPGYLARPAQGSGRGVLVLHEAAGPDDFTRDACDRLARAGFAALAPDLSRGCEAKVGSCAGLEAERVGEDLEAALEQLVRDHSVTGTRVGAVGFCLGGHLALVAASLSSRVGAVVDFYGLGDQPADLGALSAPVLGIFAGDDEAMASPQIAALRSDLEAAGVRAHLRVEPGVRHGFMNPARAEHFDAVAAAASWDRMLAFLRAELA